MVPDVLPGVVVMKALAKRVTAMERPAPMGCDTCRFWNWMIVVTIDEDGTETGRSRPDACPDCGRVVLVGKVLQLVGVDWDAV
jgi:hypothetical protein